MGLFGKKEACVICGGKLSLIGSIQLADGKMCPQCREKCTQFITIPQRFTASDIMQNMADADKNKRLYSIFSPQEFPYALQIDYRNGLFAVATKKYLKLQKAYIFRFDELKDYSIEQDGNTISKSGAGSAIVGGLLFGGVGLVAGGLMGRKTKETITKMSISLKLDNPWATEAPINIVSTEIKKGTATYKMIQSSTETLLQALDTIMKK